MGFSRHEYCSGLPFPSPGDFPNPGIELVSPVWQTDSLSPSYLETPNAALGYSKDILKICGQRMTECFILIFLTLEENIPTLLKEWLVHHWSPSVFWFYGYLQILKKHTQKSNKCHYSLVEHGVSSSFMCLFVFFAFPADLPILNAEVAESISTRCFIMRKLFLKTWS